MVDIEKLEELRDKCNVICAFKYDGLLVKGLVTEVIRRYLKENPSKKFRTWLIDKNLVIKEV